MIINPELVENELQAIDDIVAEMEVLVNKTESNISQGWNSANAQIVSGKIEKCKENISGIKTCINSVRERVKLASEKRVNIDTIN